MKLSEPHSNPDIRIISLGAGVQSTVMALMAAKGELTPMPDCAIFADTGYEPIEVYDHLEWLEKQLPFPTYVVTAKGGRIVTPTGNIKKDMAIATQNTRTAFSMPTFTKGKGMKMRTCTAIYKIDPVKKKTRELLGLKPRQRAKDLVSETWMGISMDEMVRMKESRDAFIYHRFPLIEVRMHRYHCKQWFADHYGDRLLPKSACIACPFHDNTMWRDMKVNDPVSFADAVEFDKSIRHIPSFDGEQYLHRSCLPLDQVDFQNAEDKGQMSFLDECEGMCGV